jgi:hypothetical protein
LTTYSLRIAAAPSTYALQVLYVVGRLTVRVGWKSVLYHPCSGLTFRYRGPVTVCHDQPALFTRICDARSTYLVGCHRWRSKRKVYVVLCPLSTFHETLISVLPSYCSYLMPSKMCIRQLIGCLAVLELLFSMKSLSLLPALHLTQYFVVLHSHQPKHRSAKSDT